MKQRVGISGAVTVALFLLWVQPVEAAYIDPNTGGMLFQLLAALFALFSGFVLFFSSRIRMAFARFMRMLREKNDKRAAGEDVGQD